MSAFDASEPSFTEDRLLGGRIRLKQPAVGYRVAIDPVFLAASVPAEPHQLVLDVGCGSGAAMLCVAARVPHSRVVGLEMQRDLVRLAGDNIILNGLDARASPRNDGLLAIGIDPAPLAMAGGTHNIVYCHKRPDRETDE